MCSIAILRAAHRYFMRPENATPSSQWQILPMKIIVSFPAAGFKRSAEGHCINAGNNGDAASTRRSHALESIATMTTISSTKELNAQLSSSAPRVGEQESQCRSPMSTDRLPHADGITRHRVTAQPANNLLAWVAAPAVGRRKDVVIVTAFILSAGR